MGNSPYSMGGGQSARLSTFYRRDTWIEGAAEDQLTQSASLPGMRAVAGFPDLHPGRHGPVGAAFLSERLYPQIVGPDIGCGMALYRLDLPRRRLKIDKAARRLRVLDDIVDPQDLHSALSEVGFPDAAIPGLIPGLGTLGGGNHFCEVQTVEDILDDGAAKALGISLGSLCLLVHTGSRGHGARAFNGLEARWNNGLAPGGPEALGYIELHDQSVRWARLNREFIARRAASALHSEATLLCDAPHNLLTQEGGLWLHRKGAAAPDRGLAPLAGSRESLSFLVACHDDAPDAALGSLSHGAGRRYDRASMHGRIRKTKSALASMEKTRFGGRIICEDRNLMIEEAGHAYKDSRQVISDLAHFGIGHGIASLAPLITFKTTRGIS